MKQRAVYPGTFDPPTKGHEDIAQRALEIFEHLIIAVVDNRNKNVLFTLEERVDLWKKIFPDEPRVTVVPVRGLMVDFVKSNNAGVIVRGLRAISDFEYELQIASANRDLDPTVDTVFFTARGRQLFVSSSIVKELAAYGAYVGDKAPPVVCVALAEKFKSKEMHKDSNT